MLRVTSDKLSWVERKWVDCETKRAGIHLLEKKNNSFWVDEQVRDLLFISLTGFPHKTSKVPMKGYKSQ